MDILGWIAVLLGIIGAFANIAKKWWCFIIWFISNALFITIGVSTKDWPQVSIFTFYQFVNIYGMYKWHKHDK